MIAQEKYRETVPGESELTFNIMFIPGEFKYLGFLVQGYLEHMKCSFRLVSNCCTPKEKQAMESFCRSHSRLEFLELPFPERVHHSRALTYLQSIETSRYFCFMDPDTVITGPVLGSMLPLPGNCGAVFSGQPVWQEDRATILPPGQDRVMGRYGWTQDGTFLGYSYFCIYRNQPLSRVIQTRGWGFDRVYFQDLPPHIRLLLVKMKLHARYYDTGKVVNTLLREDGAAFVYSGPQELFHLGGIALRIRDFQQNKEHLKKNLHPDVQVKPIVGRYFINCLDALADNQPIPPVPQLENDSVRIKVKNATRHLVDQYHDYNRKILQAFG